MANKEYIKTTVPMPTNMVRFLHNMGLGGKTANGGYKVPKSTIVRAICQAIEEVHKKIAINLSGARTQEEIKQKLLKAMKKYQG